MTRRNQKEAWSSKSKIYEVAATVEEGIEGSEGRHIRKEAKEGSKGRNHKTFWARGMIRKKRNN
jgi:hypothetical protein